MNSDLTLHTTTLSIVASEPATVRFFPSSHVGYVYCSCGTGHTTALDALGAFFLYLPARPGRVAVHKSTTSTRQYVRKPNEHFAFDGISSTKLH